MSPASKNLVSGPDPSTKFFLDGLEDDEEDGDDEDQGDGTDDHTADGADAEGVVTVGTDTRGKGQW